MIQKPTPETPNDLNSKTSTPRKGRRKILLVGGSCFLLTVGGGLLYLKFFLQQQLTPIIETELSDLLNRPVKVGDIERFSLSSLRFGKSEIPTTDSDADHAQVEAVEVNFDLWELITHLNLNLDVTLINPDVYLEEDQNRRWITTTIDKKTAVKEAITVNLDQINFKHADVFLVARNFEGKVNPALKLEKIQGSARFIQDKDSINFSLNGQVLQGGKVQIDGVMKTLEKSEIAVKIKGQGIAATQISKLSLAPILLTKGEIDADLGINLKGDFVTGINGTANAHNVNITIPRLPANLSQTNGKIKFKGFLIELDKVKSNFGLVPGVANGIIDTKGEYAIKAETAPVKVQDVVKTLKIPQLPVPVSGEIKAAIEVKGALENPILKAQVINTKTVKIDRVDFKSVRANLELIDSNLLVKSVDLLPKVGGSITGRGKLKLPENINNKNEKLPLIFAFQGKNIPGSAIAHSYNLNLPLDPGLVSGQTQLSGFLPDAKSIRAIGRAYFSFGDGIVTAQNINYYGGNWQTNVQASGIKLASLPNIPCDDLSPEICGGRLNANINLKGNIENITPDTITATGKAQLNTRVGTFFANQLQLSQGNWQTNVQAQGVKIAGLPNISCDGFMAQFCQGKLEGYFNLAGNLQNLDIESIVATGTAKLNTLSGNFQANNLQLTKGNWRSNIEAEGVKVAQFIPNLPLKNAFLNAQLNLSGSLVKSKNQNDRSPLNSISGNGRANLSSSNGSIVANNISLDQGKFQGILTPQNLQLAKLSPELKGNLGGRINVAGNLDNLSPTAVKLDGELNFSQGLALIQQPLTTNISWNGSRLAIEKAVAQDTNISGFIDINTNQISKQKNPLAAVQYLELNIDTKNLNLQGLPILLPDTMAKVNYGGILDFNGQIRGNLTNPLVNGQVGLNNFHVESLAFAPLSGTVNLNAAEGLNLELLAQDGTKQQIQLDLDRKYFPVAFNLEYGDMKVTGRKEKQQLLIDTQNIDIALLKDLAAGSLPETANTQKIAGKMSGAFLFNLNNSSLSGKDIAIANPTFANVKGDLLTANFQYIDGHFALSNGQFKQKQSLYQIDGSLTQTKKGPIVQGKVQMAKVQIQDVLEGLEIFEVKDFARFSQGFKLPHYADALSLYHPTNQPQDSLEKPSLFSVGSPEETILNQLRRLSEIQQLQIINEQKRKEKNVLPELAKLDGIFQGTISVSGPLANGFTDLKLGFDFEGKDWQWGEYKANLVAARGTFQDGTLRLEPAKIESEKSLVYLSGNLGEQTISGELEIANLPVDKLQEFVPLPDFIGFGGLIDARVVLGGSKDNPVGRGEIVISDATINNTSIQSTQGSFNYNNYRLNFFASSVLANNSPPLTIAGSLPIPLGNFKAKSDDLNLKLNIKDDGLAMLNILTNDQIKWLNGKGNVALDISGKINQEKWTPYQLRAEGVTILENATIAAQFIPDAPLTEINGKILFNFDDVKVESLKGKFGGGDVNITGTMPLIDARPQTNPLSVNLDNLAFNLKGIYQGGVKGDIVVTGTALYPDLGGQLELFNGKILLSEDASNNGNGDNGMGANTNFNDLALKLGDNIFISAPPILEFVATGDLKVNGTLNQPLPQGTINLKRGQVNLFTSQLYLVGGYKNTAQFFPQSGLDPYLDVRLVGTATETMGKPISSDPNSNEISDPASFSSANVGSLETIRILAEVNGFSSQLANSIELKSSPPRNKTEIVALLGGNFANTLGRGDTTLGLANLAGQAFFNSFQNQIADALGLSDFRIFPAQIIDSDKTTESFGIGMEVGVDITNDLSLSAMKILNNNVSPQFGVRYRINDNTVLRGSSDFNSDSRAVVEYQKRF